MNFSDLTLTNEKLYHTIYVALCGDKPHTYLNLWELFNLTSNDWAIFLMPLFIRNKYIIQQTVSFRGNLVDSKPIICTNVLVATYSKYVQIIQFIWSFLSNELKTINIQIKHSLPWLLLYASWIYICIQTLYIATKLERSEFVVQQLKKITLILIFQ